MRSKKGEVRMYVLRSECNTITKFGVSSDLKARLGVIKVAEKKNFYALYVSHSIDKKIGEHIEKLLTERYKEDLIRGKEWVSTPPLEIINFIIDIIGLKDKYELNFSITNQYPTWIASNANYKTARIDRGSCIKENSRGECFLRVVNNMRYITLGFCNSGDAFKTASNCLPLIRSTPIITDYLHNRKYIEWVNDSLEEFTFYTPSLNIPLKSAK